MTSLRPTSILKHLFNAHCKKCLCAIAIIQNDTSTSKMKPLLDKRNPYKMPILSIFLSWHWQQLNNTKNTDKTMQFGIMNTQLYKRENKMPKKARMIFDSTFLIIVHNYN